jgi:hypothetical protein
MGMDETASSNDVTGRTTMDPGRMAIMTTISTVAPKKA